MAVELQEFYQDLFQEIQNSADAGGEFVEDEFFHIACDYLIDAGELESANRVRYLFQRGSISLRIDGYGGDPISSNGVLSLIVADFQQSTEIETLTATDMDSIFRRLTGFLTRSLSSEFRNDLEETDDSFRLANLIADRWSQVLRVRLILISNRILSARIDGRPGDEVEDVPVSYSVWDLGRLHRYATSGNEREEIEIDLENEFGGPVALLPAHLDQAGYEAYLVVMPGNQLAEIYGRWGARLLEQNVRVFLQARGNVNRGILNTIKNEPAMFFAYNNGITATAQSVETCESDHGLLMTSMKNFQIVNGGQTTASIHAASRTKDIDLSKIFIQMKLSIVQAEQAVKIVPKISQYANTQNRVTTADFFANHPFHVRMEQFSRRIFAPSADGNFRESKWFYERARGQYQDERGRRSMTERRKFDLENPKRQVFSKTDLAKFLNVWSGQPNVVSQGAQKNFANFASSIEKEWKRSEAQFNELFYHHAVAKAIIFHAVEKLVSAQPWYRTGSRSHVVAYAIAKLAHDLEKDGTPLDFERIWRSQTISPVLQEALTISAKAADQVIFDEPSTISGEWAKQQACWHRVSLLDLDWPTNLQEELVTKAEQLDQQRVACRDQDMLNGIQAQTAVVSAGPNPWQELLDWGMEKDKLSPDDIGILKTAASIPDKIPTEKQSERTIEILKRLHDDGCQIGLEIA